MADTARPPARRVRRDRRGPGAARSHAAARRGLGGASGHPDRGAGPCGAGPRLRHASPGAAQLSAPQGRGAATRGAAGGHRLRGNDLLPPGRGAGGTLAAKVGGNFYNRDVHPLLAERIAQVVDKPFDQIPPDAPLPATHDSNFSPRYVRFAVERSLKRLGTDYIDLLQLHNPPLPLISSMDTYAGLEDLKREGKIRWYGVSVHPPEEGLAAVSATMPDTVQTVYNLAPREAEDAFFPAARAAGSGVSARQPVANGLLAGKYAWD